MHQSLTIARLEGSVLSAIGHRHFGQPREWFSLLVLSNSKFFTIDDGIAVLLSYFGRSVTTVPGACARAV